VTTESFNIACVAELKNYNLSEYIAVVGSGPSSPYITSVDALISKLCNSCGVHFEDGEHLWVFCEKAHAANETEYFRVLRESYGDTPHWDSLIYRFLVNCPFRSFVTLNYDRQLPAAFAERYPGDCDSRFSVYPPNGNLGYFHATKLISDEPLLIAIHGYADKEDPSWERRVILRLKDYNDHYTGTNPQLLGWWQTLLTANPCIFIGTTLREPGIEQVFKESSAVMRDAIAAKGHLHLLPCERASSPPHYPSAAYSYSAIKQVFYDKKDQRHTGLIDVLTNFSAYRMVIPRPKSTSIPSFSATSNHDFPDVPSS